MDFGRRIIEGETNLNWLTSAQKSVANRLCQELFDCAKRELEFSSRWKFNGRDDPDLKSLYESIEVDLRTFRRPYNFWTIDGSRGRGKSALLHALAPLIQKLGRDRLDLLPTWLDRPDRLAARHRSAGTGVAHRTAVVLPPLYPDLLEGEETTLLEHILAHLRKALNREEQRLARKSAGDAVDEPSLLRERTSQDSERVDPLTIVRKLRRKLEQEIYQGWVFSQPFGQEVLKRDSIDFCEYSKRRADEAERGCTRFQLWHRFVSDLLDCLNAQLLVLLIDDIDLNPRLGHSVVQFMRMYLSHPRIVAILAADMKSLKQNVLISSYGDLASIGRILVGHPMPNGRPADVAELKLGEWVDTGRQVSAHFRNMFLTELHETEQLIRKVFPSSQRLALDDLDQGELIGLLTRGQANAGSDASDVGAGAGDGGTTDSRKGATGRAENREIGNHIARSWAQSLGEGLVRHGNARRVRQRAVGPSVWERATALWVFLQKYRFAFTGLTVRDCLYIYRSALGQDQNALAGLYLPAQLLMAPSLEQSREGLEKILKSPGVWHIEFARVQNRLRISRSLSGPPDIDVSLAEGSSAYFYLYLLDSFHLVGSHSLRVAIEKGEGLPSTNTDLTIRKRILGFSSGNFPQHWYGRSCLTLSDIGNALTYARPAPPPVTARSLPEKPEDIVRFSDLEVINPRHFTAEHLIDRYDANRFGESDVNFRSFRKRSRRPEDYLGFLLFTWVAYRKVKAHRVGTELPSLIVLVEDFIREVLKVAEEGTDARRGSGAVPGEFGDFIVQLERSFQRCEGAVWIALWEVECGIILAACEAFGGPPDLPDPFSTEFAAEEWLAQVKSFLSRGLVGPGDAEPRAQEVDGKTGGAGWAEHGRTNLMLSYAVVEPLERLFRAVGPEDPLAVQLWGATEPLRTFTDTVRFTKAETQSAGADPLICWVWFLDLLGPQGADAGCQTEDDCVRRLEAWRQRIVADWKRTEKLVSQRKRPRKLSADEAWRQDFARWLGVRPIVVDQLMQAWNPAL